MNCIICNSNSDYYFSKTYSEPPFQVFMEAIGPVDYYRCENCGFVISKTHVELDENVWINLNNYFHNYMENPANEKQSNQPPYAEQAMMINLLGKNNIIDTENMIDYAAGYGTLSNILLKYYGIRLPIADAYIHSGENNRYIPQSELKTYNTVINSAMFEHVLKREDLDKVNNLVDVDGCLVVHTVVCENIPNDPNWFYLHPPVHTAFHTNRSMEILMGQWGYQSSIYCLKSKCWILFKHSVDSIAYKIEDLNKELQSDWFFCKNGFVDYWKGF